jgi:hypothetical protein
MQKQHGFQPLGPADGAVKRAILGGNGLRLFGHARHAELTGHDRMAAVKAEYQRQGPARSNLRYGYVPRSS